MKLAGIFLFLAAILVLLGYGFYQIMITADIPFWIRAGLAVMATGLLLILLSLLRERARDMREEVDEDDFGQHS